MNRWYQWPLVSVLALSLFAWAGVSAVWGGASVSAVRFNAANVSMAIAGSKSIEIHALAPDWKSSSRVGRAYFGGNGMVDVSLYPDVLHRDMEPANFVVVEAGLKLLWQLTPPSARSKAERSLQKLVVKTHADLEKILASEKFQKKYQKQFLAIVNDTARKTFDEPETKAAMDVAYKELLGTFGQEFVAEYLKLLTEKSGRILDTFLENFTKNILNLNKGGVLDFDPIRRAVEQVVLDPLFKVAVRNRLETFLTTEAAANLSATFGRRFVVNTYSDPRLYDLLNALLSDLAYSDDLKKIELAATRSIRDVVLEVLTRGNDSMGPVGAAILQNAFAGSRGRIVLLLTDEQLKRLSREYPKVFIPFGRRT